MTQVAVELDPARFAQARRDPELAVLEGIHALKHAARFGARVLLVAVEDRVRARELAREVAPDLGALLDRAHEVGCEGFATLAPRPHPTGVIALARRPRVEVASMLQSHPEAPLVLLEEPGRPGNVGAVIRVAAAAGAAGVLTLGAPDPWCPEAIRGAAGLHFALPVARLDRLPRSSRPLVAVTPDGQELDRASVPTGALLAFGNERHGLSAPLRERAALAVRIPMRAGVSSLNLATAVAVALYGWRSGAVP